MPISPLSKKLGIKPGHKILIAYPPNGYGAMLDPLPPDVQIMSGGTGPLDVVQCFVSSQAEVSQRVPDVLKFAAPGALVWLCYPKRTSKLKTDISRDEGWDAVHSAGWQGVALVSIDDIWSTMRFRPSGDIKLRRR